MARGWQDVLGALTDTNIPPVDIRTPEQRRVQQGVVQDIDTARANPNYGLPSPELQKLTEDEMTRDILGRVGSAGSGNSGYAGDQVRKGLVDFRIKLVGDRQRMLDAMRSSAMMGPGMAPADQKGGIVSGALRGAAGAFGARAGNAAANDAFGEDPNQSGGAPGTTGYRQPDQRNGGMRVGV